MTKKQVKHIINDHYRKLKKQLNHIIPGFDPETIHQFRVEYKKLRAFLRMISRQNENGRKIKFSKNLKKAYKISRTIRDLQLQQQRILETTNPGLTKPKVYLMLLQKEIKKLKPEFSEIISEEPVTESKKKTNAAMPDKFTVLDFKLFIQEKWDAVNSIIVSGHLSDERIHAIRKELKDLFYNLKIFDGIEQDIASISNWKENTEPYIDQLQLDLGNFQDKCMAINLVKLYYPDSLSAGTRKELEQLKKKWENEKLRQKRLLVKKLKSAAKD
jgi:CHAD domain-containing protein